MVSAIPFVGNSGRTYEITTWGLIDPEDESTYFKAVVQIDGSEVYRSKSCGTEEEAYQDAFDWSKAQEKKNR